MTAEAEVPPVLDDASARARLDKSNLISSIEGLPQQCEEAWSAAWAFDWRVDAANVANLVVLGMGGSAIAGDILRSLAAPHGGMAVASVRGYEVPAYVGPDTLVVACSHSGNTDETVSALQGALARGAQAAVITTGGRLAGIAQERGLPAFVYTFDGQPRCALGYQLMALLALGQRAGLLPDQASALGEALTLMRRQREFVSSSAAYAANTAKQLAVRLHGRVPVIVGTGVLADAAHRWKTQVNENGKSWAFWDELPEMDHNTVVGLGLPDALTPLLRVLFLLPMPVERRAEVRYEATAAELDRAGVAHERIDVQGASSLAGVLSAVYFGDFVSYYLGLLNGIDPTPIDPIARIKDQLAKG
jgi:glucose/mannose-6-phosphate isomerase